MRKGKRIDREEGLEEIGEKIADKRLMKQRRFVREVLRLVPRRRFFLTSHDVVLYVKFWFIPT